MTVETGTAGHTAWALAIMAAANCCRSRDRDQRCRPVDYDLDGSRPRERALGPPSLTLTSTGISTEPTDDGDATITFEIRVPEGAAPGVQIELRASDLCKSGL